MKAYMEHIGIYVEDIDWYLQFFEEVFELCPYRFKDNDGIRNYWLHGGIQLIEAKNASEESGRLGHICLIVEGLEDARKKALEKGCSELPKHHWVKLPDGLEIEMFEAAKDAVDKMDQIIKKAN